MDIIPFSLDSGLYNSWIASLFDRDETKGDWRFDIYNEPVNVPEDLTCDFVMKLNSTLPATLEQYTDWQSAMGLEYIYNNACSNLVFYIKTATLEKRLSTIQSMKNLYKNCFDIRCQPVLGHLSENGNPLNNFCYMLWDITIIDSCDNDDPDQHVIMNTIIDVLEYALTMRNIACIESALHGLGHMVYDCPRAVDIIQAFIDQSTNIDPRILSYAQAAKTGCIQ